MYLQLRGLCPDSNIDQFYIPRNKKRSGKVNLIGFKNTIIEYEGAELAWNLRVYGASGNTTARSESPLASFVLGAHEWRIEEDNLVCSPKGEPYTRLLKLTGCREGEFTCSDGQCIRGQTLIYQTTGMLNGPYHDKVPSASYFLELIHDLRAQHEREVRPDRALQGQV